MQGKRHLGPFIRPKRTPDRTPPSSEHPKLLPIDPRNSLTVTVQTPECSSGRDEMTALCVSHIYALSVYKCATLVSLQHTVPPIALVPSPRMGRPRKGKAPKGDPDLGPGHCCCWLRASLAVTMGPHVHACTTPVPRRERPAEHQHQHQHQQHQAASAPSLLLVDVYSV
jgi:hypothetical protein